MKTASQPTLPGVPDYSEPQLVSAQRLARTITEANGAGFEAVRLECWKRPFGYRVTFQRMANTSKLRHLHRFAVTVKPKKVRRLLNTQ